MDKELNIHEQYKRDCEELNRRYESMEIGAHEWQRRDRALLGAYVYECLHRGDQGCNDLLAKMESAVRLSA